MLKFASAALLACTAAAAYNHDRTMTAVTKMKDFTNLLYTSETRNV